MLNSYIWRWEFPLPHTLPCVLIYWFVNTQFWFCKWCHKLHGSETLKPINTVVRKQDCRSLHCYLTFALTTEHFRNKQAMDPWLRKLQAYSDSCLVLHHPQLTRCQCSAAAPPHSGTQDHSCLSAMWWIRSGQSHYSIRSNDRPCPWHASPSVLFFPKADPLAAAWDVTCPLSTEGNLACDKM